MTHTKTIAVMALFVALSFIGSYLRIFGTIAFDSLPGFLAALLLGPAYGALIGFLGHLFTAFNSGFPLSVPLHIAIAISMAITMYGYGLAYKVFIKRLPETTTLTITGIVGTILNAPVSLALSIGVLWIMAGSEAALGLLAFLPALVAASIANIVISILLFKSLRKVWNRSE